MRQNEIWNEIMKFSQYIQNNLYKDVVWYGNIIASRQNPVFKDECLGSQKQYSTIVN